MIKKLLWALALLDLLLFIAILWMYEIPSSIEHGKLPTKKEPSIQSANPISREVNGIELLQTSKLVTGRGVKSVLFNQSKSKLYSINLESGSVYEFDRELQRQTAVWKFNRTPSKGYDYTKRKWVGGSYEEKPVEGCFTHGGKYLWTSWHNGGGVAAWQIEGKYAAVETQKNGRYVVEKRAGQKAVNIPLFFFKTGDTPKVIIAGQDQRYLFVANWHSNTVTCINIEGNDPNEWKVVKSIKVGAVPRGMCFLENGNLLVAQMASGKVSVIDTASFQVVKEVEVGATPRHLEAKHAKVYASLSSAEKLLELSQKDLSILQEVQTGDDPRTIAVSPDGKIIFIACYADEKLQAFRSKDFKLLGSWDSKGSPVGLAVWQEGEELEVWVCNYRYATIKVFKMLAVSEEL